MWLLFEFYLSTDIDNIKTKSVPFQGKTIVLESLTPVLSPKEKEQRKKEIERRLYDVFSKYGDRFH